MKSLLIQTFCLLFLCLGTVRAQQYQLVSPNGKLSVTVDAGEALTWQIAHDGTTVLQPSVIALQGRDEKSAKKAITFANSGRFL
ncbi:glycoside hydrolase family 97 N-terminal domain-containing protein [Bacteroides uniformis]|uniref:glycoside hydrolase family 97 N-terminal domain-containing protein n=1 Tax=Bacteroides uniformis TaxID=820 RepID=UPI00216B61D0|nr:glycoside hydrolase family 97 N-terminal domain-containing protein [Bacteroides uniformis]